VVVDVVMVTVSVFFCARLPLLSYAHVVVELFLAIGVTASGFS